MMGSKSDAKKILKQYAKAERNARIEYIDRVTGKAEWINCQSHQSQHTGTLSLRKNLRLAILVGILSIIAASIGIAIAYDGGINVPGLDIREGADELIVSYADGYGSEEGDKIESLEPGYIPEGYELEYVEEDVFFNNCRMGYRRIGTEYDELRVNQYFDSDARIELSMFMSEMEIIKLGEYDVCEVDTGEYTVHIAYKDNVIIVIYSRLPNKEVGKIIESMR